MTVHQGPRADSRAYSVLVMLIAAGGTANVVKLRDKCAASLAPHEFQNIVLGRLQRLAYVQLQDATATITAAGQRYIQPSVVEPAAPAAPVAAPYRKPKQDLIARARQAPIRDGAFEYRDIPSRHGDQRVPFKPGFPGLGATQG
jgi:hypothetical protein